MKNHANLEDLATLVGIDIDSPEQQRAVELVRRDREFLAALVKVRKDRGLTQEDVAVLLGVTQPTVAAFERQEGDPKLSTIRRYAQAVGALVKHVVISDEGQLRANSERSLQIVVNSTSLPRTRQSSASGSGRKVLRQV